MNRAFASWLSLVLAAACAPNAMAQWIVAWPARPIVPAWTPVFPAMRYFVPAVPVATAAPATVERYYFLDDASAPPINSSDSQSQSKSQPAVAPATPRVIIREYYLPDGNAMGPLRPVPMEQKPEKLSTPDWKREYESPDGEPKPSDAKTPEEVKPAAPAASPPTPGNDTPTDDGAPRT